MQQVKGLIMQQVKMPYADNNAIIHAPKAPANDDCLAMCPKEQLLKEALSFHNVPLRYITNLPPQPTQDQVSH